MIRISDAELEVMKVIWRKNEVTSTEIVEEMKNSDWNSNTIRTLITRLTAKKAIGISKKEGKNYTYVPLIKQKDYRKKRIKSFLKQFYEGSMSDMVLNFVEDSDLSKSDIEYLLKKIDEK